VPGPVSDSKVFQLSKYGFFIGNVAGVLLYLVERPYPRDAIIFAQFAILGGMVWSVLGALLDVSIRRIAKSNRDVEVRWKRGALLVLMATAVLPTQERRITGYVEDWLLFPPERDLPTPVAEGKVTMEMRPHKPQSSDLFIKNVSTERIKISVDQGLTAFSNNYWLAGVVALDTKRIKLYPDTT
jgi:hypothetical protein